MSVSIIITLSWLEGITIPFLTHRQTAVGGSNLRTEVLTEKSIVGDWTSKMLLYLNILVLFFLRLALSSPMPLTTPTRGCPTCETKPTQTQASEHSNATTLAVGELCGVYTLSCAHGLRCAPPQGEPRPLRALLEGRGVCSNASSISPTENTHTAGKTHTYSSLRL